MALGTDLIKSSSLFSGPAEAPEMEHKAPQGQERTPPDASSLLHGARSHALARLLPQLTCKTQNRTK